MSSPTIVNDEFWSSSLEQTAAGDANILDALHNHNKNKNKNNYQQRNLDAEDGTDLDNMWNLELDYEPVE